MVRIYTLELYNSKASEMINALDEKEINYEICQPTTEWSFLNKIKSLPVLEVDNKILNYNKALKWIKKYKG